MTSRKPEQQESRSKPTQSAQRAAAPQSTALPFSAPKFAYAAGDPQEGNLATPINSSKLTRWFINQLPAYRPGVSPFQRGLQIGLSHGFWLLGPFVALGPLRNTGLAIFAGLLSALGLVIIAVLALSVYAESSPPPPIATLTTPQPPAELEKLQGWQELARGFLFGGMSGAVFAAILLLIFGL